jgi:hypothetical protein
MFLAGCHLAPITFDTSMILARIPGAGQPGANPNAQPPPIEAITAAESDAPARKLVKCT